MAGGAASSERPRGVARNGDRHPCPQLITGQEYGGLPYAPSQNPVRRSTVDAAGDHGPILVVDDDAALAEMLQLVLIKEGFSTAWVGHGSDVMDVFREHRPALVLLDLMLPGRDGIRICQDIRRESGVPIIMLTARTDTPNVVQGLGAGADDYVCKPFRSAELIARIRARLRTPVSRREEGEVITVGDLTIDPVAHLVQLGGE